VDASGEVSGAASDDDYQLEEIEVTESDFMRPESSAASGVIEFRRQWESLGDTLETVKKYQFPVESLQGMSCVVLLGHSQSPPPPCCSSQLNPMCVVVFVCVQLPSRQWWIFSV
jgi:hypothetical protein